MMLRKILEWRIAKAKKRREEAVKRDPLNVLLYDPLLDGELDRIRPPRRKRGGKFHQFCSFCNKEREIGRTPPDVGIDSKAWYCGGCGNGIDSDGKLFSRSLSDYGAPVRRHN